MRIGGDFEIDVSMLSQPGAAEFSPMPNLYKLWVDTGRSALLLALEEIIKQGGVKQALLPAYICPSVIAPFVKLGFNLRFYSAEKFADIPLPKSGETILFAYYFGKKNLSAIEWVKNLQANCQIFVIEDCVQASLNSDVGETGDFVITSYRKFLQQPDGAILGTRREMHADILAEPDETYISAKLVGKLLRSTTCEDGLFLKTLSDAENMLEELKPRKMSWLSGYMLRRTDIQNIKQVRRTNWLNLHNSLNQEGLFEYIAPLFDNLTDEDVPLGFSVQVNNGQRDQFRKFLARQHIYCPIHWTLDHLKELGHEYPDELVLSSNMLTLPIDQRLTEQHIEYMVSTIVGYFRPHIKNPC
jgi:hypothetical protein